MSDVRMQGCAPRRLRQVATGEVRSGVDDPTKALKTDRRDGRVIKAGRDLWGDCARMDQDLHLGLEDRDQIDQPLDIMDRSAGAGSWRGIVGRIGNAMSSFIAPQVRTDPAAAGHEASEPAYQPSPGEPYMSPAQVAHFRRRLTAWREALMAESDETLRQLRDQTHQEVGDEIDRATRESTQAIDAALARIEDGSYGYCEETGEPIGLARLEARPVATLSLEAQERRELRERWCRSV
jgi:DnaK suppressor protein